MRRYHQELAVMERRRRFWFSRTVGGERWEPTDADRWSLKRASLNYWRRHTPLGCGRARCGMCHSEKRWGRGRGIERQRALARELRDWELM